MDLGLKGTIALVTGGTSGIGLATARLLLAEGARVALCGRDATRTARVGAELAATFGEAMVLARACDVLDAAAMSSLATAIEAWGGGLDLLVNNAGQGRVSTFATTTDEAWREELDLKFFSQVRPLRAVLPLLQKSRAGAVVAVNSLLALQPEPHMVATSAARAGVQNLVKSLATELAPIRVNSILLGIVESGQWERRHTAAGTDQPRADWYATLAREKHVPLGRFGLPDEAARAIVFLGSPAAGYITGARLEVSGGTSRFI